MKCSSVSLLMAAAAMALIACSSAEPGVQAPASSNGSGDGELPGAGHSGGKTSADGAFSAGAPVLGGAAGASSTAPAPSETTGSRDIVGEGPSPGTTPGPGTGLLPEPGVLTAGTWDDNQNYARFSDYRHSLAAKQLPGLLPLGDADFDAAHSEFSRSPGSKKTLDVSLVIDTTGSMGDEIAYLQSEFLALSKSIESAYPASEQRWSLVVYRDTGDVYVARWFDFRSDPEDFRTQLAAQSADGGGDLPESPEVGLARMAQLAWRADSQTAKLAFWVADAPHHDDHATAMSDAVRAAHDLGVHMYPVAASGVDELAEVTMRSAAQLTGGRYLFLTDDSGVGGEHKEPTIPCYFVTRLDNAILRMVDIELSGTYREPSPGDILRTGGNPSAGKCQTEAGQVVQIY